MPNPVCYAAFHYNNTSFDLCVGGTGGGSQITGLLWPWDDNDGITGSALVGKPMPRHTPSSWGLLFSGVQPTKYLFRATTRHSLTKKNLPDVDAGGHRTNDDAQSTIIDLT